MIDFEKKMRRAIKFEYKFKTFEKFNNSNLPKWIATLTISGLTFEFTHIDTQEFTSNSFENFRKHATFPDVKKLFTYLYVLRELIDNNYTQDIVFKLTGSKSKTYTYSLLGRARALKRLVNGLEAYLNDDMRETLGLPTKHDPVTKEATFNSTKLETVESDYKRSLPTNKTNFKIHSTQFASMTNNEKIKSFSFGFAEKLGSTIPTQTQRIVVSTDRNQSLSKQLKQLYSNTCQICQERVQIGFDEYMSESHHIQPVGGNHKGPDIATNIIILCPNHHVMFDRGAITIDLHRKIVIHSCESNPIHGVTITLKHEINEAFINYHNRYIFKGMVQKLTSTLSKKKQEDELSNYEKMVVLEDDEKETITFNLPNKYNKHLMKEIEKKLVSAKIGDIITHMGFSYKVVKIH